MHKLINLMGLVLVYSCMATAAESIDMVSDDKSVHCLSLQAIDGIEVLDRENIAFHMKDDTHYINHLPNACPNLRDHSAIMYTTPLNRLCSPDIITVLEDFGGDLREMGACSLGSFRAATLEEIRFVKTAK